MAGEGEEYGGKLKEVGAEIRARRESLGLSIEEVQRGTRIRSKYLLAVEAGDETKAPGITYFKAFLKTYSTFLGLDGARYSQDYQETLDLRAAPPGRARSRAARPPVEKPSTAKPSTEKPAAPGPPAGRREGLKAPAAEPARKPRTHRPARRPRRSVSPAFWGFLLFFALAAAVFYTVYRHQNAADLGGAKAPPASTSPGTPAPGGALTPAPPSASEPASEPEVTKTEPDPSTTIVTVDRTPIDLTIKVAAGKDSYCWVRVYVDGEVTIERTLGPGEEEKVSAKSEIQIRAGRPWVISLGVNGKDLGAAGGEFGPVKDITVKSVPKAP